MEKDYSLLRPFDLEAANFGTKAYWFETECVWFGPSGNKFSQPMYAVEHNAGMSYVSASELRAYPLAWVEGRPVYKGDVLYNQYFKCDVVITGEYKTEGYIGTNRVDVSPPYKGGNSLIYNLTWQKPKTKREGWVNIVPFTKSGAVGENQYKIVRNGDIFDDYETAKQWADKCKDVLATVPISWEE